MALGDIIARLAVHLDLDSASFETGAKKAATTTERMHAQMTKAAKGIGVALAGMVTLDGINKLRDMHRAALDAAGGLGEQAKALGVSSTALQQFRFAATQVGLSTEQMDTALGQFSKRLGQAELTGKGPFIAALKQIGLTLDDLKGKSSTEQIALIADGIKGVGSASQQSALQVQFFGKQGQTMATLLAGGAKDIRAFADEANRAGIVLSEGDIAKADETADKLAKLDFVLQARLNKTMIQHSDAVSKAEVAWGEFKIKGIAAIGEFVGNLEKLANDTWSAKFTAGFKIASNFFPLFSQAAVNMGNAVGTAIRNMVTSVYSWIVDKLGRAWNFAVEKVNAFKNAVKNMADAVVFHSYVPDMVDGIAAQMARLDAVMVNPAKTATERVKQQFEKLQSDVEGIMRRLFPDAATQASVINDRAALRAGIAAGGAGGFTVPQLQAALKELQSQEFKDAFKDFELSTSDMAAKAEVATVRIAKSFKDMATETISSISSLANAVKSGGFFGILEALANVGLQLGSIGLFGKKIATNINAAKGYASGTRSAAPGIARVGEHGMELVAFNGGEHVFNSRDSRRMMGGGNVYHISGNLLTPEFWEQIQAMDAISARAGSAMAVSQMGRMQNRSLA